MKRSSCASNRARAFTLVELLVAVSVTGVLLSSVCGIYFAVAREWQCAEGEAQALVANSQACSRIADYASRATGYVIVDRFQPGDTLVINLPADQAYADTYTPVWSDGTLQYRPGTWIAFYLSDSSGSYHRTGDILWAATLNWADYPSSITPDSSWSLYYGGTSGKIAPLTSLSFTAQSLGSDYTRIGITAVSSYRVAGEQRQLDLSRQVCLRNTQ